LNYSGSVLIVAALLLAGCQVSPQPAKPIYHPAVVEQSRGAESAVGQARQPAPTTVTPIKALGVINELRQQGQSQLQQAQWRGVIVTAERGLRVDRREAGFYWLLARAYQGLGESGSAAEFARQGLRYAPRSSRLYRDLQALLLAL